MPDYTKVNDVAAADIVEINGVAYASIAECNGFTSPSLGATRWVIGADDALIAHAANSDRTSWTTYDSISSADTNDNDFDIAFGKDNSGNGIYICTRDGGARELQVSGTDVTSTASWTDVSTNAAAEGGGATNKKNIMQVLWGARSDGTVSGTWMAVGHQGDEDIYRSTDGGANWSAIDLSSLSGHSSSVFINGIASDGLGKWAFAQANRFYYSTNDGASFAVSTPFSSGQGKGVPGRIHAIIFTNNSWVIMYSNSSQVHVRSCAASDITDWGDEVRLNNLLHMSSNGDKGQMAADASGRVVATTNKNESDLYYFDVNGKVISNSNLVTLSMSSDGIRDVATDGSTWLLACSDGDVWESTNAGASWSQIADNQGADSSDDFTSVTCDVVLPL